ncbi:hypothetical protein B6D51_15720 [Pseudomonas chlororaphis subsp. chlororaphis]|nr:hypothetical protein B6D51_15720 [Pseudomonas chlororaphis subsp. chlororaphis]
MHPWLEDAGLRADPKRSMQPLPKAAIDRNAGVVLATAKGPADLIAAFGSGYRVRLTSDPGLTSRGEQ